MSQLPENKNSEVLDLMRRVFPFKQEEGLKVYGILSIHNSTVAYVSESSMHLQVFAAYTLDEALKRNEEYISMVMGAQRPQWSSGRVIAIQQFETLIPVHKVAEMVEKIKGDQTGPAKTKIEKEAAILEAHTRYVFDMANAGPYEKGVLTSILGRFWESIKKPETV